MNVVLCMFLLASNLINFSYSCDDLKCKKLCEDQFKKEFLLRLFGLPTPHGLCDIDKGFCKCITERGFCLNC